MVELTVALPIYKNRDIAWLALESLCRQKDIDFEWELIVAEEQEEEFGKKNVKKYSKRLHKVGCSNVKYVPLYKKVKPIIKRKLTAKHMSGSSKVYLFQGSDDYSQPYRLAETYNAVVKQDYDYVSYLEGVFYDFINDYIAKFDKRYSDVKGVGLNASIRAEFIKLILSDNPKKKRGVLSFIVGKAKKYCKNNNRQFTNKYIDTKHWCEGLCTNGFNTINKDRRPNWMRDRTPRKSFFTDLDLTLDDILPFDIASELKKCKKYFRNE